MLLEEVSHPTIDGPNSTHQDSSARRRSAWRILLRLTISVGLIAFLLRRFDVAQLLRTAADVRWELWGVALGLHLVSQAICGLRWGVLSRGIGFAGGNWQFLKWFYEGMFFSLCLPSSIGGDVFKCYRLAANGRTPGDRTSDAPKANAIGAFVLAGCTIAADRGIGFLAMTACGSAALVHAHWGLAAWQFWPLAAGTLALTMAAMRLSRFLFPFLRAMFGRVRTVSAILEKLAPYAHSPALLERGIAASAAAQVFGVGSLVLIGCSMGLTIPVHAYVAAYFIVGLLTVIPISINGVGLREGGLALLLAPYGLSPEGGVTLGMLWFAAIVSAGLAGGVIYLFESRSARAAQTCTVAAPHYSRQRDVDVIQPSSR